MAGITLDSIVLHLIAGLLIFVTPVLSFLATGLFFRGIPRWRRFGSWLLLASPITLLLMIGYFGTFAQATVAAGQAVAGLTQRILIVEIHAWFAAVGWFAFRSSPDPMRG
jgi:hypothetical protein